MGKDPQDLIDEVQKISQIMGITPVKSAYLAFNQLKRVAQLWFK